MITVEEASKIILENPLQPGVAKIDINSALGRVLAESVTADRSFPPFHRVTMDGIAFAFDQWRSGRRRFRIEGVQAAGEEPRRLADVESCYEVMTGAVLPDGCDTVVRYEDITAEGGEAMLGTEPVQPWQNVHKIGTDAQKDEVLLKQGQVLAAPEIALLASVGKRSVAVFDFPAVAVISTGDELVDIGSIPQPWQVRRSNSYALLAALRQLGIEGRSFHLRDEPEEMAREMGDIVASHDVLILSGGVSKGKFDFVPEILVGAGYRRLFHQVNQRPGKPLWFGISGRSKVAFALPGNPVSTLLCFYRYVRPWFLRSMGIEDVPTFATLSKDFSFPPPLTYFLQVSVQNRGGTLMASPIPGGGSGDFVNLAKVDGFLELPPDKADFNAGEVFRYVSFRS